MLAFGQYGRSVAAMQGLLATGLRPGPEVVLVILSCAGQTFAVCMFMMFFTSGTLRIALRSWLLVGRGVVVL